MWDSMSYDYVLDTYAWKEYFDGTEKGKRVASLFHNASVGTSVLVLAELSDLFERSQLDFDIPLHFIQATSAIVPLTPEIAIKAGKFKTQQRKNIKYFGLVDALIYLTAQAHHAKLVTSDPHFSTVKDVLLLK